MATKQDNFELGSGYYWIGSKSLKDNIQCNPYLLVDDSEAVLFGPGSALDFDEVRANIEAIVPLDKVHYVVLLDEDPNLAESLPKFQAAGLRPTIVADWRTWSIVRYYGLASPVYIVDEHGNSLSLASGRKLQFMATPHLHSLGAMAAYDKKSKVLISGDLFGAFQSTWSLYADDHYLEGMKAFHEYYMPSKDLLRPVMELLGSLDLAMILPQHGPIIRGDPKPYIESLAGLEFGMFPAPKMLYMERTPNGAELALDSLMKRAAALFGADRAKAIASESGQNHEIRTDPLSGEADKRIGLWENTVKAIYLLEGASGFSLIEPYVAALCAEFSLPRPDVYGSVRTTCSEPVEELEAEVARLQEINEQLYRSTNIAQQNLMKDAVTGLNNEAFFRSCIEEQASVRLYAEGTEDDVLAIIGVDEGMARIEYQYGPKEVELILREVGRIIQGTMKKNQMAFRIHGASFALWMPFVLYHEANELCEKIRTNVESSKSFIEPITVSIGMVALADIKEKTVPSEAGAALTDVGIRRLREAKKRGGNTICSSSEIGKEVEAKANILVVDDDKVNADVIKTFLENAGYAVAEASDGDEALKKIAEEGFDLIISELMLPKIDGFMLRDSLLKRSGTKDIPFILLSHRKDESSVIRSYKLGIDYYLRKPFLFAELIGMVQNLLASGVGR
jgi:diguanylate cyclase (GGDEF)-like protein